MLIKTANGIILTVFKEINSIEGMWSDINKRSN